MIIGAPVLLGAWFATFVRWRLGVLMLLAYLPVAGAVTLWLSPNPAPLLFKDFLFVIPVYLSIALVHLRELGEARVPVPISVLAAALALLAMVQMFNPNLSDFLVALVGAKVWLLYLPMLFVGAALVRAQGDLVGVLRVTAAVAVVPFAVGLIQFALASSLGPERAIEMFYGASAAEAATQGFGGFDYGADLYRIPATFTFVAQYGMFGLAMVAFAYALGRYDPHQGWRLFGRVMMGVAVAGALLCGARGNFVFLPLLIALIYVADARVSGGLAALVLFPAMIVTLLWMVGFDPFVIFGATHQLFTGYGSDLVLPNLIQTLRDYPMGQGTGTSTGAARHIMNAVELRHFAAYEGYYSKTIAELGIPGLLSDRISVRRHRRCTRARAVLACRGRMRSVAAAFARPPGRGRARQLQGLSPRSRPDQRLFLAVRRHALQAAPSRARAGSAAPQGVLHTCDRKYSIVGASPSSSVTLGAQPSALPASAMSGRRRTGSSAGSGL